MKKMFLPALFRACEPAASQENRTPTKSMPELRLFADLGQALLPVALVCQRVGVRTQSFFTISRCGTNGHFAFGFLNASSISRKRQLRPGHQRRRPEPPVEHVRRIRARPSVRPGAAPHVGCVSSRARFQKAMRICRTGLAWSPMMRRKTVFNTALMTEF